MARRDALTTVTEDIERTLAERPKPKPQRKRYPSDTKTPAVACRLGQADYEELAEMAQEIGAPLAHVLKAIVEDFLERYRQGTAKVGKVDASGSEGFRWLVTRVINGS